jgi:putative MFS transporter
MEYRINGSEEPTSRSEAWIWVAVIVAALGYFVDVIDLWLFSNFRVASLKDLGLTPDEITNTGALLLNTQQVGLLLGGVLWGILGDRRGRASVMFGSILLYSIGNILNAFVTSVPQYAALRFITGLGLAGEIGAGITLVCEILPRKQRGLGTTFVTGLGVAGAIIASLMGKYMEWRTAFFVGGVMGLALFVLRALTHDSGMFERMSSHGGIKRGSLRLVFNSWERAGRFLACIAIGMPIYLLVGTFGSFAHEISAALGVERPIAVADAMLYCSIGLTLGDIFAGLLSQLMKSRKLPLAILIAGSTLAGITLASGVVRSSQGYLWMLGILGLCSGSWACLITTAAEQFGTNIRATVTTMVPNLVRATAIPITMSFVSLKQHMTMHNTLLIIVTVVSSLAFLGVLRLRETFHEDLDYYDT